MEEDEDLHLFNVKWPWVYTKWEEDGHVEKVVKDQGYFLGPEMSRRKPFMGIVKSNDEDFAGDLASRLGDWLMKDNCKDP